MHLPTHDPEFWRERAERLRKVIAVMTTPEGRDGIQKIVARCERLAETAAQRVPGHERQTL